MVNRDLLEWNKRAPTLLNFYHENGLRAYRCLALYSYTYSRYEQTIESYDGK